MGRRRRPFWTLDSETDPFAYLCLGCESVLPDDETCPKGCAKTVGKRGRAVKSFIWGLYDGDSYQEFLTVPELIDYLTSEEVSAIGPVIYAHNGGRFDYHELKEYVNSDESIMVISGRLAKFKIGSCEFRDSLNILPVALKTFAKDEIDYRIMEADVRHIPKNWEEIRKYLRSDCVNLYNFIELYQKEYGRGLTQAGASMRYWSKNFDVVPPRQTAATFEQLRPFFYGGRVQCFEQGHVSTDFKLVDIRSAYPFAMLHRHPYTATPTLTSHLPPMGRLEQSLIKLDAISRGAFPYRGADGKLYFPFDEREVREYCITGWEFVAAMELNAAKIIRIKEVYQFDDVIDFKDYINFFYNKRKEAKRAGDKAQDIFAKLFMNSLYGKFASDPERYREWLIATDDSIEKWSKEGYERRDNWFERYLMSRPLPELVKNRGYYNIATAASITGFVRAHLYKSLMRCGEPLYCDTDSIAAKDVSDLNIGEELGMWQEEGDFDEYAIAGKKLYAFRCVGQYEKEEGEKKGLYCDKNSRWWKIACKGVDLTHSEIIEVSEGRQVTYVPKAPTFSVHKNDAFFTNRTVSMTAQDIGLVPEFDF